MVLLIFGALSQHLSYNTENTILSQIGFLVVMTGIYYVENTDVFEEFIFFYFREKK